MRQMWGSRAPKDDLQQASRLDDARCPSFTLDGEFRTLIPPCNICLALVEKGPVVPVRKGL